MFEEPLLLFVHILCKLDVTLPAAAKVEGASYQAGFLKKSL